MFIIIWLFYRSIWSVKFSTQTYDLIVNFIVVHTVIQSEMAEEDAMEMGRSSTPKDITWIFDQYCDESGRIHVQKFEDIVETYRTSLTEQTIRKLLNYADTNKDEYITKDELQRLEEADPEEVQIQNIYLIIV